MLSEPTVFVVDDDLAVETFATGEEFLQVYDPARPGCLVLDVRMPGMGGLRLQEELAARRIILPVIILTGYAEVQTAVRAFKTGAFEFIEKPYSDEVLLDCIQRAIEADRHTREAEMLRAAVAARFASLTPREREVMLLVTAGKANKVIASDLGLSPKTVEVHRAAVMEKMGAGSLAELVRLELLLHPDKATSTI
jgi:two-component system response regulator FixJ